MFVGKNTSGKTNLLEALTTLAFGKSGRGAADIDLIAKGENSALIAADVEGGENFNLEIRFFINPQTERLQKKYLKNGVPVSLQNFAGNFLIVSFSPDDLRIVSDSPGTRRAFLNSCLMQTDAKYRQALNLFETAIKSRNAILEKIKDGRGRRAELSYWDKIAIENGQYLTKKREEFMEFINVGVASGDHLQLNVIYDRSEISAARLSQYAEAEVAATSTLVGPHRDDLQFFDGARNLKTFGSRGEQRMTVLLIKLKELEFIEKMHGETPVLLLDDIFSELDLENRSLALELLGGRQTIITTADEKEMENLKLENCQKVYLK